MSNFLRVIWVVGNIAGCIGFVQDEGFACIEIAKAIPGLTSLTGKFVFRQLYYSPFIFDLENTAHMIIIR
jgi:hypothetical protein